MWFIFQGRIKRMRLTFYGGAGKVTGSNFLIAGEKGKLLVDCGIEQGSEVSEENMHAPFPYDPASIDALVVTHAHLDHVGRIPKLVKDGFAGPIYLTPPTRDLAELILRDSVGILSMHAKRRGLPPLYEEADVDRAIAQMVTLPYHEEKEVAPGLSVYLRDSGHILGAASVRITDHEGARLGITSDIGNSPSPLLRDIEVVGDVDALVMECVYGDRLHPEQQRRVELLRDTLREAIKKGGAILIPAFSMERTQLMLYELSNFFAEGALPHVPVYLDSPLAIRVTQIYEKWGAEYFNTSAHAEMVKEKSLFEFPFLTKTLSQQDSRGIEGVPNPKILIAGAGMSHGGRIGKWESLYLPDPRTTLIIVGYQAPGSPGRRMQEGAGRIRIDGKEVRVRAGVKVLEGWSAHADRDGLMHFAESCLKEKRIQTVFAALGEPGTARFFAQRLHDYLGTKALVPQYGDSWVITKATIEPV